MISCIFVKNNNISQIKVKNLDNSNIYKKCGYKNEINFKKINEWIYKNNIIELWSKEENCKNNNLHFIKELNNNVSNKSIFLLKSNDKYISFKYNEFLDFFKIETNEINEINEANEANGVNEANKANENITKIETNIDDENNSEYSYDSELSYDLYCYSDEENL